MHIHTGFLQEVIVDHPDPTKRRVMGQEEADKIKSDIIRSFEEVCIY